MSAPDVERFVVDAFPSVVCPVTDSVPLEVRDEVAVIAPPVTLPLVNEVTNAVTALNKVAKRLLEVAFAVIRLVILPVVEKRFVTVPTVVEDVLSTV